MSIHFYDSKIQRSTGNFLTKSIKRDLDVGVSVIYIDTISGFSKHDIPRDTKNLQIIDSFYWRIKNLFKVVPHFTPVLCFITPVCRWCIS